MRLTDPRVLEPVPGPGGNDGAIALAEHLSAATDVDRQLALQQLVPLLELRVKVLGEHSTARIAPDIDAKGIALASEAISLAKELVVHYVAGGLLGATCRNVRTPAFGLKVVR